MTENNCYFDLLKKEMVVARGCTEPIAIAYAAFNAKKYLKGEVVRINVKVSANILKNAMSVIIPGTGSCGVPLAAALGAVVKSDINGLELLNSLKPEEVERAKSLVLAGKVTTEKADSDENLYILVTVYSKEGFAKAEVQRSHTNITHLEADGRVIFHKSLEKEGGCENTGINIDSIFDFAMTVDTEKLSIIKQSVELNRAIAKEGLKNNYGLNIGKNIIGGIKSGTVDDNIANYAMGLAAAAADARMSGCMMSVMSNSGSGNQGITTTVPVLAVFEKLDLPQEKLLRALTLSNLIAIYIKSKFGRLSALCGATVAATGASCGICYLLGGGLPEIKSAIQNMIGDVTGMLCDGAKKGCALKVSTCTNAAIQSALFAIRHVAIEPTDGIIEDDVEKTIDNLCSIATGGTKSIDRIILDVMLKKSNSAVCGG